VSFHSILPSALEQQLLTAVKTTQCPAIQAIHVPQRLPSLVVVRQVEPDAPLSTPRVLMEQFLVNLLTLPP